MVLMGSIGFRRGFIEEVGRLIGLIVSTVFSLKYYLSLSAKILTFVQLNTFVVMVISFSIIFVLILFIVRVLTRFFHILLIFLVLQNFANHVFQSATILKYTLHQ